MGERLRSWVRSAPLGRGRWMSTLGGFLALQTFSLLLMAEVQGRTAEPDPALVLAGFAAALLGLVLAGAGLPLMAHARRVRKWRQRYLLRLQDARAWFVQGRIAEADLAAAKPALEEAAEGRFAGEAQRTAGDVQRRTGLLTLGWGLVAGLAAWRLDAGTPRLALAFLAGAALVAGALLAARGWPEWRAGKVRSEEHLHSLDEEERRLLVKAARTAPSPQSNERAGSNK